MFGALTRKRKYKLAEAKLQSELDVETQQSMQEEEYNKSIVLDSHSNEEKIEYENEP